MKRERFDFSGLVTLYKLETLLTTRPRCSVTGRRFLTYFNKMFGNEDKISNV
jgi:hypothetical protein